MFKCNVCAAQFKTQKGLDVHKCRWYCKICGKKLVTLAGYERHTMRHAEKKVEAAELALREKERQEQREQAFKEKVIELKSRKLFSPKYKEGDKVFLSLYVVTKPTHQYRNNRWVRVRYEEERKYYSNEFIVGGCIEPQIKDFVRVDYCLRHNKKFEITYYTEEEVIFYETNVFCDLQSAEKDAQMRQKEYKEECDFADFCR